MVAPRAVIFDMDGLLLDSERVYEKIWSDAVAACGFSLTRQQFLNLIGRGRKGALTTVGEYFSGLDVQTLAHELEHRELFHLDQTPIPVKAGVSEITEYLQRCGKTWVVATSTMSSKAQRRLAAAGLAATFPRVIGGDQVKNTKPAPDIFLRALDVLRVAPHEALVLEDSANGIRAAHAAGIPAIMVPDQLEPTDDVRILATAVMSDLTEVQRYLARHAG